MKADCDCCTASNHSMVLDGIEGFEQQHKSNQNTQQEEDKASEENLVRETWQKQRESEQLKVNPEEILEEEEKRTNPICIEE
jgi:hypothetical protein